MRRKTAKAARETRLGSLKNGNHLACENQLTGVCHFPYPSTAKEQTLCHSLKNGNLALTTADALRFD